MTDLAVFWSLVLLLAVVGAVLRDVLDDDPRRATAYRPPRSHPDDDFERSGSSFR